MDKINICAGIVTYNPNIEIFKNVIDHVSNQVQEVLVFDNNSKNIDAIRIICNRYTCTVISECANRGIAYALNRLCEYAINKGYSWILTLDHDTIISDSMINSYISIIDVANYGIICPRVNYVGVKIKEKYDINSRCIEVPACMTSGSLMNLEAWAKTSHFDELMFIDSVDNDICYKLRMAGYKIIRDNNTFMEHNLGYPVKKKFLFLSYSDFQYSPLRLYYIVRNRIYLTMKYWRMEGVKFVFASIKIVTSTIIMNLSNKERRVMVIKGLMDAFRFQKR